MGYQPKVKTQIEEQVKVILHKDCMVIIFN